MAAQGRLRECSCHGANPDCFRCYGKGLVQPGYNQIPSKPRAAGGSGGVPVVNVDPSKCPICHQHIGGMRKMTLHYLKEHP